MCVWPCSVTIFVFVLIYDLNELTERAKPFSLCGRNVGKRLWQRQRALYAFAGTKVILGTLNLSHERQVPRVTLEIIRIENKCFVNVRARLCFVCCCYNALRRRVVFNRPIVADSWLCTIWKVSSLLRCFATISNAIAYGTLFRRFCFPYMERPIADSMHTLFSTRISCECNEIDSATLWIPFGRRSSSIAAWNGCENVWLVFEPETQYRCSSISRSRDSQTSAM